MNIAVKALIDTYDEYIGLLEKAEGGLLGLAYAHGYRCPPEQVAKGKELRENIAKLKSSVIAEH